MHFDIISLFPDMFDVVRDHGITGRAFRRGLWSLNTWNPRDYTHDVHRTVDDRPYGGGPGMVMLVEPLEQALLAAQETHSAAADEVILMSPAGRCFDQDLAGRLAEKSRLVLVCGRYEGIDQRFVDRHVSMEVSIGDYVLSGGELPALVLMDSVLRLLPGALHDADSAVYDSFSPALAGLLDSPHYTRPEQYQGIDVPLPLLSGHHKNIAVWRRQQSLKLTAERRPDLLANARSRGLLNADDEAFLASLGMGTS